MQTRRASLVLMLNGVGLAVAGCAADRKGVASSAAAPRPTERGRGFHRPAGTGMAYFGPGDLYTFLVTGAESGGSYFQMEAIVPPGGGPPPHIHHREDETFYLTQGQLEMQLGDKLSIANAGDFVNIPRGTPHRFKNIGSTTAKMLVTFAPAGMEHFFEEVLPVAHDRTAPPPPVTEELIKRMLEAGPRHGIEFIPPPGAAPAK